MVEEDPALWEIENIEQTPNHFLYRSLHKTYWEHWEDKTIINENIFSIRSNRTRDDSPQNLSVDWNKYCEPKSTLIRSLLLNYARNNNITVEEAISFFGIDQKNKYKHRPISIHELDINDESIAKARENFSIFQFMVGDLIRVIENKKLEISLEHAPIRELDEINKFLNRAHSVITKISGKNSTKVRALISDISNWCEGFSPPLD